MTEQTTADDDRLSTTRRNLLRGGAALGTAAILGETLTGRAHAQSEFDGWFDDVSNYDGVVDKTGQSEVEVVVGAEANGGGFGYGPAAIRVSPDTTVVWKWNGEGGQHNVVADDESYESELVSDAGHTFSHTFETEGVSKYFCLPHKALGMKGAVVVGGDGEGGGEEQQAAEPDPNPGGSEVTIGELIFVGSVVAGLLAPLAFHTGGSRGDGPDDRTD